MSKPRFEEIKSYEEFKKYFWYKEEMAFICSKIGCNCNGDKNELDDYIENYFNNKNNAEEVCN